ncbi:hypothetical protein [Nocardia barduliensis]|uniref:hypothetical protein n=1 Tax=Nocardia barduliensis TaxID=2736643 RepID=UPI001572E789|nr:hypothetical protein [Nocardia barduliensis]
MRWYTGGPSTLAAVTSYLERCELQWQTDAAIRLSPSTTTSPPRSSAIGTIDIRLDQLFLTDGQANLAYGIYRASAAEESPLAPSRRRPGISASARLPIRP